MPFSDNIFHVRSIDFKTFWHPLNMKKHVFSFKKTTLFAKSPFGEKHDFLIDFIIIFGSIFLQFWHRFSILFRYRFQGHIFCDIFRFLVPLSTPKGSHWRPSGRHFRLKWLWKAPTLSRRPVPGAVQGAICRRYTLHVRRCTCNVARATCNVAFSTYFLIFYRF